MIRKISASIIWIFFACFTSSTFTEVLIRFNFRYFSQFFFSTLLVLFLSMWILSGHKAISTKKMFYSLYSLLIQFIYCSVFLWLFFISYLEFHWMLLISLCITGIVLGISLVLIPKLPSMKINGPLLDDNDLYFKKGLEESGLVFETLENGKHLIQEGKRNIFLYLIKSNDELISKKGKFYWKDKWNGKLLQAQTWILSHFTTYKRPIIVLVYPYAERTASFFVRGKYHQIFCIQSTSHQKTAQLVEEMIDYIVVANIDSYQMLSSAD